VVNAGSGRSAVADGHESSTRAQFVALLRDRRFAALFVAHIASNLGDWLAFLALWAVVGLHGGAGTPALAALATSYLLPLVIVMPLSGACVDRWPLRRVLVATDLLRAAVVAAFVWTESLAGQCVLLFALQALGCFFNPAQAAAVVRLVPPSRLVAANSLTTQAAHAAKLIGPAVAGLLVAAWGAESAFWIDAATFAWSALWLATLPALPPLAPEPGARAGGTPLGRALRGAAAGLRFVGSDAAVRATLAYVAVACAGLGAWLATFAVLARDRWELGARGTGFMASTFGAGAILGAAAAVPLAGRFGAARVLRGAVLALAAPLAAVAAADTRIAGIAATLALGAATALVLVPATALVQTATPPPFLARVQGAAITVVGLVQAASVAAAGLAARVVPAPRTLAVAALGVAVAAFAAWLVSYRGRRGERETCGSSST
jgi:predicted MFS family arabinose efflux permease